MHEGQCQTPPLQSHFNSIKVRLERNFADVTNNINKNFNSIKVRLELEIKDNKLTINIPFQFHKGTIRTNAWSFIRSASLISIP